MKNNKYLKLFIAAFLALNFIGAVNAADIAQEKDLRNAVIQSVEKVKEILVSPDSLDMKEIQLNALPQLIRNVQVSGSSESTKDAVAGQFEEIIKKVKVDLRNNPDAGKMTAQELERIHEGLLKAQAEMERRSVLQGPTEEQYKEMIQKVIRNQ